MNRIEQHTNPVTGLWKSARGLRGRMLLTAVGGVMLMGASAWGQGAKKEEPPLDINAVQPTEKKEPAPAKAGEQPKAGEGEASGEVKPPPGPNADAAFDGERYAVSRFVLEYKSDHPEHVPLEELAAAVVTLGVTPGGYVEPREGMPTVQVRVGDVVEGAGGSFYRSGLNTVAKGIAAILTQRGYIGHFVEFHPEDIDPATAADKRGGKRTELRLRVWTGKASMVRTISSGDRLASATKSDPALRINSDDPVHARIRAQTPVEEGALLRKDRLDDYVFRLNRHPGRHVDVALSPGENDEEVVVDYLVAEGKPWSVYAQLSNTGTKSTNEWRERFGFVHNQLTGHDDILRLDYTTAGFDASHAFVASYDFPLWSDRVRIRPYFTYTKFEASDVGQAAATFTGETYAGGVEVTGTILQHGAFFLDAMAGMRVKNETISNQFGGEGDEVFWIPYVGLTASRDTESMSTQASLTLEMHPGDWGDTDPTGVQLLGRPQVDREWQVLKFFAEHSFYIEPLLNPKGFKGDSSSDGPKTLAHEVLLSVKGQYGFDKRLLASEEDIAGGMFTVRGYPESVVAGDTMVIGSAEYRFHVPRAFGPSEPGKLMGKELGWFGGDFRWQPQQDFGRADWDWVLKAFVDVAQSRVNDKVIGEDDYTLVGAGIGTEVQWKRNMTMRLEWGVALHEVNDPANKVDSGDNEVHFLITVLY
jgi:hemolysin activation/secretion protein